MIDDIPQISVSVHQSSRTGTVIELGPVSLHIGVTEARFPFFSPNLSSRTTSLLWGIISHNLKSLFPEFSFLDQVWKTVGENPEGFSIRPNQPTGHGIVVPLSVELLLLPPFPSFHCSYLEFLLESLKGLWIFLVQD